MKSISAALKTHLQGEVLSVCTLWKITRTDGRVFGFTDTSKDITYLGQKYLASTGHTPSNIKSTSTLSVDNLEVRSVLDSSTITEDDVQAGLWDYAQVEIMLVNHEDLSMGHMNLRKGWLGNIKTGRTGFTAELRGMMQPLQQTVGRLYTAGCDAFLGDSRCGVALGPFTHIGYVSASGGNSSFTIGDSIQTGDQWYENTVLLLHGNGADTSQVITDNSYNPKSVSANGNAMNSTLAFKYGTASLKFDGTGDYLTTPDHIDFDLSYGDWTIECFVKFDAAVTNTTSVLITKRVNNASYLCPYNLFRNGNNKIAFISSMQGTSWNVNLVGTTTVNTSGWYHVAVTKKDTVYRLFVNGAQEATATVEGNPIVNTNNVSIGAEIDGTYPLNGYLDEIRITKGTSRYNSGFTEPAGEFAETIEYSNAAYAKADGYYNGGIITWLSGPNKTYKMEVKTGVSNVIVLQQGMPNNIEVGDTFELVAGCDKVLSTCISKYNNVINFRGFPHIPGHDKLISG